MIVLDLLTRYHPQQNRPPEESPMPNVACSSCGKGFMLGDSMIGKRVRCSACGNVFVVPEPDPSSVPMTAGQAAMFAETESVHSSQAAMRGRVADVIDYEIFGNEMQYVEITLDPNEQVIAEAGAMMHMAEAIKMETVFGNPSGGSTGFWDKVKAAGKRVITGESMFMTTFTNVGNKREIVGFGAPYPGKILPIHLDEIGGEIVVQKDAFLCGARGIQIEIAFQKRIGVGLFGGEGFIMQRLKGDGIACVHAGGTIMHRELAVGERLRIDTGCLMALQPTVDYNIEFVGGFKNTFFGGEGLFLATLTGPGKIWLQSLPFSRLAGRMLANAPQSGGSKGEGSILGGIGNMFMGDNS
jgi:uncharacterized protein (TIGR00266 family)